MSKDALDALRAEIDVIDERLVSLIAERFACTDRVGRLKITYQLPAVDAARESWQMARLEALANAHGVSPHLLQRVFRLMMDEVVGRHRQLGASATE